MKNFFSILIFCFCCLLMIQAQETVKISGRVTDFNNNPIDSCQIRIQNRGFEDLYTTYTDKDGYYSLDNVQKGNYTSFFALRPKEYPRANSVPEEDMRLEFWAWNIIADRDLTINPRYDKLEIYGTTAYEIFGGYPGLFIYFRPMSVTKVINTSKANYLDKRKSEEQNPDISVKPEFLDVKIFADDEPLKVNSVQPIQEYVGDGNFMNAYIVQVDRPKSKTDKPYRIIKVVAENKEFNEMGENWYFYEIPKFKNKLD